MSARMNISVPDDLKKRMDKVREPVNWSSLAVQAFEQELGQIAKRKVSKKMTDVIQRLRASKIKNEGALDQRGFEDGRRWATNDAEAKHLRRLADTQTGAGHEWPAHLGITPYSGNWSPGECFYMIIENQDAAEDFDRETAKEFWETVLGDADGGTEPAYDSEGIYILAFAQGAIELWGEVEDKI